LVEVRKIAARIAAQPPVALRLSKRLLKVSEKMDLPEFLDLCACFQGMSHHSEDHLEAVSAFLDKRTPLFRGK
ncbi:MAG: enoyl-CoA hydratase, partial [Phycisphaerae bacterium]|nr:enoyl-CoA hydratase [Phycisphaerae bacterium]NIV02381.1 enoyl-CoA hydratase [Phycisphaerae bacterium]NIV69411.1 enoyl-CoA hydratase [Phycisphaerae bacterium]NIW72671.1 enoyl-CoA hydratase [candidate division KSB1 bacterium]NIX28258.1 enoyl-CoA hydratase [Phycisphaerae bacterium]